MKFKGSVGIFAWPDGAGKLIGVLNADALSGFTGSLAVSTDSNGFATTSSAISRFAVLIDIIVCQRPLV
jgi:hypothetical protein